MQAIRQPAPSAQKLQDEEIQHKSVPHGIQKARQAYLTSLIENATFKKEELKQEADANIDSTQTFQSWLAEQIFESANHLTLQFTEAVMTRAWDKMQSYKLEQVKAFVRPVGRSPEVRSNIREASEAVLRKVQVLREQMDNMWSEITEQTLALNQLCKVNGFSGTTNKNAFELYEMGQTFAVQSFTDINKGELFHIENIAELFLSSNQEHMSFVIRNTPFFGGKFSHCIEVFPEQSVFEHKTRDQYSKFWINRIQWSVGTYVESLRFTQANGTQSPKFGTKPFTHNCDLTSPIKKVEVTYRERGIVSLVFYTATEELRIQGDGEGKHSDKVEIVEGVEKLVQFRVRLAQNLVQGISFGVLTNQALKQLKGSQ